MPSSPARLPGCCLCLCPLALSGCSLVLSLPQDFPLSDTWARPALASLIHLFLAGHTTYSDLPETVWRPRHQSQKSPQMSCPMTRAAVSSVSAEGYSFTWELNYSSGGGGRERNGASFEGTNRKSSGYHLEGCLPGLGVQENTHHPGRCPGTHSLRTSACREV